MVYGTSGNNLMCGFSKRQVSWFVIAYMCLMWSAVAFRIDSFPLSWAPMYSVLRHGDEVFVRVWNDDDLSAGFDARRRDGGSERVTREDLNLPRTAFWRLYYERAFGQDPNKIMHQNAPKGPVNRWLRGLEEGELEHPTNWEWRVLRSVNRTLGREPGAPDFIVELRARARTLYFARENTRDWRGADELAVLLWRDDWSMHVEPL